MSANGIKPSSLLAPQYVNGVYVPVGLLLIGTAIVKREWLPFAAVLGALLGAWRVYNNRMKYSLYIVAQASDRD